MKYRKLYIFVEGNDDELFYKRILLPLFLKKYTEVEIFKYAQWKRQKVELFLQSIITLNYDYIFTADIDLEPTVNSKKNVVRKRFGNLEMNHIYIAIKEIESWYLAGCTPETAAFMHILLPENTNEITKEDFNAIGQTSYRSRIDFMLELLKRYSYETAVTKNDSYAYFLTDNGINAWQKS